MQTPKALRGIWSRMNGKGQDLEISEELTNAYFGNQEAWQINQKTATDIVNNENEGP